MRSGIILLLLLSLSITAMTQSSSDWKLYLNKTKLLSASTDSMANVQLSKRSIGTVKFDFSKRDTGFNRSVMIMNEKRNTLLRKELTSKCKTVSFSMSDLLSKISEPSFTIYIVDIPSNPAQAALVRVVPVPICHIEWKE